MRERTTEPSWVGAQLAVQSLLLALGFDPAGDEGLKGTPQRVANAYREFLAGYDVDTKALLSTTFDGKGYDQMVVLRAVPFTSLCEHHLVPFVGTAGVVYIPDERLVGLSKLARLVEAHARRLQIQEVMTEGIANDIQEALAPIGVAVVVRAQHLCMTSRGVQKPGAEMVTSALRGAFMEKPEARAEAMELLR